VDRDARLDQGVAQPVGDRVLTVAAKLAAQLQHPLHERCDPRSRIRGPLVRHSTESHQVPAQHRPSLVLLVRVQRVGRPFVHLGVDGQHRVDGGVDVALGERRISEVGLMLHLLDERRCAAARER